MARNEYRHGMVIESAERLNCSASGNPRYLVRFTDGTSHQTSSDAACSYDVLNYLTSERGKRVMITITRAGRITHITPEES